VDYVAGAFHLSRLAVYTLRSAGHEPRIAHTAAEHATQIALVAAGLGLVVIFCLGCDIVPAGVRMIRLDPTLYWNVYVVWRSDAARCTAIRAAIQALKRERCVKK
jgi:DNA-binding transcriptional LysR family regulator